MAIRYADPQASLPRLRTPATGIVAVLTAGILGTAVAVIMHNTAAAALSVIAAILLLAAIVTLHIRTRKRQNLVDLYLLRLLPLLGWQDSDHRHVTAARWRNGWIGQPTRLRVSYNPLADEALEEILIESRRLAERAFHLPFKMGKHKPGQHFFTLEQRDAAAESKKDAQAQRVTDIVLKTFGAGTRVEPKFNGDELNSFTVRYEVSPRLAHAAVRARNETYVSTLLESRWRAFWDLQNDTVRFEVRPALSNMIPNPNVAPAVLDPLATYDKLEVPIGRDEDGNLISWRPKRDPHGLITGKTGKGKTVVLLGIIMFLAAHGWKIWGIDGKRIELLGLREWPNVELIAGRIDHQARVGHEVFTMMQKRFEDYEAGRVKLEDFEPVLFVIDEYKTFRNAVTRWFRSVKPKGPGSSQAPVVEEISDFVSLARKVRMHLVIGLQRPDAEFLTGDMRDNFNFRVSLGRLSPDGAKMMWDSYSTGVAIPPFAIGRGIAHNASGTPVEIQTFWTPDPYQTDPDHPELWVNEDDLRLVEQLRPAETLHELKEIIDPEEDPNLDGDTDRLLDYNDYMTSRITAAGQATKLQRKAAGVFASVGDPQHVSELDKLQREEEEPEVDDSADLFAGYTEPTGTPAEAILDESGELAADGMLLLVDPDNETWGLVDTAEFDPDDEDYIAFTYRDFESGDPGAVSVPIDDLLQVRSPIAAAR